MRGKGVQPRDKRVAVGITPACAGKRGSGSPPRSCRRDHPRVCGEKIEMPYELLLKEGSPPRVRGKARQQVLVQFQAGITPACAGKSPSRRQRMPHSRDHPRVCGEKSGSSLPTPQTIGSPPRVRGKVQLLQRGITRERITPAYAGKSAGRAATPTRCRDHPRACGEKCPPGKFFFMTVGSPPRVRGKVCPVNLSGERRRITPACAGKRLMASGAVTIPRDHPRVCGEKLVMPCQGW